MGKALQASAFPTRAHLAECEDLTGELAAAEERLVTLSTRGAPEPHGRRSGCVLRINLYY